MTRQKLHQHVDITVWTKIVAKRRAEDGETRYVMLLAEFCQRVPIDRDVRAQRGTSLPSCPSLGRKSRGNSVFMSSRAMHVVIGSQ